METPHSGNQQQGWTSMQMASMEDGFNGDCSRFGRQRNDLVLREKKDVVGCFGRSTAEGAADGFDEAGAVVKNRELVQW